MKKLLLVLCIPSFFLLAVSFENTTKKQTTSELEKPDTVSMLNIEMVFVEGTISKRLPVKNSIDDFYIGKYEITQKQWKLIMGNNPSNNSGCDSCPVEGVNCEDIGKFITKLNALTGKEYRLPVMEEWIYALWGGLYEVRQYSGSCDSTTLYKYANYCDKECAYDDLDSLHSDGYTSTAPVGSFMPNELGIYDMTGNVHEWHSQSGYYSFDESKIVEKPCNSCVPSHTFGGGGYRSNVKESEVFSMNAEISIMSRDDIGFRLALSKN